MWWTCWMNACRNICFLPLCMINNCICVCSTSTHSVLAFLWIHVFMGLVAQMVNAMVASSSPVGGLGTWHPSSSNLYPSYFFSRLCCCNLSFTCSYNSSPTTWLTTYCLKSDWQILRDSKCISYTFRLSASTTLFSFPFMCLILESKSHKNSSHLACLAFRVGWSNKQIL